MSKDDNKQIITPCGKGTEAPNPLIDHQKISWNTLAQVRLLIQLLGNFQLKCVQVTPLDLLDTTNKSLAWLF